MYLCQTNGADISSVRCGAVTAAYRSRQCGTQSLYCYPTVHGVGRRRRHPARGGACVVVANGIQDGDNGGDEESHKSTHAEPNETELSCSKAPGLYLSDFVVWLLAMCFLHRINNFSTKLMQ